MKEIVIDLISKNTKLKKQEIENIIQETKAKYVIFQALKAPEEAANIHQNSLKAIEMFIGLLDKIKLSQREKMGEILGSAEVSQMQEIIDKTKEEIKEVIAQGKLQLQREKEQMIRESREEIASIAVEATRKILSETIDEKKSQKLAEQVIDSMSK